VRAAALLGRIAAYADRLATERPAAAAGGGTRDDGDDEDGEDAEPGEGECGDLLAAARRERGGRRPRVVAVSHGVGCEAVREVMRQGICDFGEVGLTLSHFWYVESHCF
jgi:hypothetical protein